MILHIQTVCIPSPPPDLDCDEVPEKNFKVTGSDPHGFDADNDGIGCEGKDPIQPTPHDCDPSYPTVCIPSPPPDLDCDEVPEKNFKVTGSDPHGFDADNDGIGCEGKDPIQPTPHDCDPSYPDCMHTISSSGLGLRVRSQRRTLKSQDLTHMDLTQITMA